MHENGTKFYQNGVHLDACNHIQNVGDSNQLRLQGEHGRSISKNTT